MNLPGCVYGPNCDHFQSKPHLVLVLTYTVSLSKAVSISEFFQEDSLALKSTCSLVEEGIEKYFPLYFLVGKAAVGAHV